ncbi:BTAD domain-containing putative transcriptional regulator [Streptomyces sp. DH37]|uniref:AfsR/SARP family transcriptional regulator n=1 Tax=Streptomyces sp. DH37 TaxID=3040122 RepID=UPI0024414DE6|nr:BTAD domain-containing putative transcriptional regulator [Streptomyces sp. DH37]MDG9704182.1 BTAD domain-containing putative transcriptional regulator [Streptomyces sp. DH37]
MLTALAIHAGKELSRDELLRLLWDEPPASAEANLRGYLSALRKDLGSAADLAVRRGGGGRGVASYLLATAPATVDQADFVSLAAAGRRRLAAGDPVESCRLLTSALELWRGPAGIDAASSGRLRARLDALDEMRLNAVEDQAEACVLLGSYAEAAMRARSVIADHPLRERSWGILIAALYGEADFSSCLSVYGKAQRLFREELGISPSPDLLAVHSAAMTYDSAQVWRNLRSMRERFHETALV